MDTIARRCVALVQLVNKRNRSQEVEAAAPTIHPPAVRPLWQVHCCFTVHPASVAFGSQPVVLLLQREIRQCHKHSTLETVSDSSPDNRLWLMVSTCACHNSNAFEAVSGFTTDRWLWLMVSCSLIFTRLGKYCNGCCCREMAATFDIGKLEGRDRFPNLDKACQHTIECIQVSYFFALYTAVWSSTVNIAFKIQERLHLSDSYSACVPHAHFYPYPGTFSIFAISSLSISCWRHHAYEGSLHHAAAVAALPIWDATNHGVQQAARS